MTERIGEGELCVMEVLWDSGRPLTAVEIHERVADRDWRESTVKTMLSRLVAKSLVTYEEDGRRFLYRPSISREAYAASESRRLIDRLFGGRTAPLVAHLARNRGLSPRDIAELRALLKTLKS